MEKHLLVTLSGDRKAWYSLRFLKNFLPDLSRIKLTLFYVAPRSQSAEPFSEAAMTHEASLELGSTSGGKALVNARQWLISEGADQDNIKIKQVTAQRGTINEIVDESARGLYDAVLFGRRGLSWLDEIMEDSVSSRMLWQELDFPIWVCHRPPGTSRHGVLVCVDGSEESIRVADHVGFMLADLPGHDITLFHMTCEDPAHEHAGPGADDAAPAEDAFAGAQKAILDNGVDPGRIKRKAACAKSVPDGILAEAESGDYAVVAVGRRFHEASLRERFFPGSVSTRLMRKNTDITLWISH